jgi:hypothetical protein
MAPTYPPLTADGYSATWDTWAGDHRESLTVRWDNEAWTAVGSVGRERVEYAMRIATSWDLRQLMLFRDLEQPDLWLATDGRTRWGEMNGAHRPELDGCVGIDLACSPFPHTLQIRRLPLAVGEAAEIPLARVDVQTLGIVPHRVRYARLESHLWSVEDLRPGADAGAVTFAVDAHGVPLDWEGEFRRVRP